MTYYGLTKLNFVSLTEIFPALKNGGTPAGQALSQFLALLVTAGFAIVGGLVTGVLNNKNVPRRIFLFLGLLLHIVGKMEGMEGEDFYNDDWNIDGMEAKEELSGDLKHKVEDWRNKKYICQQVSANFKSRIPHLISGWNR